MTALEAHKYRLRQSLLSLLRLRHRPFHGTATSGRVEAVSRNAPVNIYHKVGARGKDEEDFGNQNFSANLKEGIQNRDIL